METAAGYANLIFTVFYQVSILVLILLVLIHQYRYQQGRGGTRGGKILPWIGGGGGFRHRGRDGAPLEVGEWTDRINLMATVW